MEKGGQKENNEGSEKHREWQAQVAGLIVHLTSSKVLGTNGISASAKQSIE